MNATARVPPSAWRRGTKRALIGAGAALVVTTGLIGFAHTKAGRPLLAWLQGVPGCPLNLEVVDLAAAEQFRVQQLARRTGEAKPRSHGAAAFELGVTRLEQVAAWGRDHAGECTESVKQGTVRCTRVQVAGEATITDLYARADVSGRLVALDLMREATSSRDAVIQIEALGKRVIESVGPATLERGKLAEATLDQPFGHAAREFAYTDYVARLSATRMGKQRIVVREQYQWAPDNKLAKRG
jgi:hypothetical protein